MKLSGKETPRNNRLQVFLSHSGLCSRRRAMELIFQGRVVVNGKVILEPSTSVDPAKDKVFVDGKAVLTKACQYVMLNKPKGYTTTLKDPHAEKKVSDLLPKELQHLYPAGRLDKDTEGLLLFTNDGEAAYRLTHPKFRVDKVYFVCVNGVLNKEQKSGLEKGIVLDGELTAPCRIGNVSTKNNRTEFLMTIHEGRKRQIREMLKTTHCPVIYLKRIKQGPLELGRLETGKWRYLTNQEVALLKNKL